MDRFQACLMRGAKEEMPVAVSQDGLCIRAEYDLLLIEIVCS